MKCPLQIYSRNLRDNQNGVPRTKIDRLGDKMPNKRQCFKMESWNKCSMGRPFMSLTIVSMPKS